MLVLFDNQYCRIWPTISCFADWSKRRHVTFIIIEIVDRSLKSRILSQWLQNRRGTVVHATSKYDDPRLKMSHSGSSYFDVALTTVVHHLYIVDAARLLCGAESM